MEAKASSRHGSPIPRRLGSLPVNQRSYSRVSSKGTIVGDESPLMSPLPFYPRRRSVTFGGASTFREERPTYNAAYSAAASEPVSPVRARSPQPASILKPQSSFQSEAGRGAAAAVGSGEEGAAARQRSPPRRCRSDSRQRIAARRNEAQLHHSFYDDSFVEEFVLSSKSELEKEENLKAQLEREEKRMEQAEKRVSETSDKLNAIQQAKKLLLSVSRRQPSVTPSPSRDDHHKGQGQPRRAPTAASVDEEIIRSLESDPDPQVQAAITELTRVKSRAAAPAPQQQRRRRDRSMAIVSGDEAEEGTDSLGARKRARLEKLVADALAQQKKSKSKRSVVVINWSDDDDESTGDGESEEAPSLSRKASRARKPPATRSRSLQFEDEAEPILLPRRQHKKPQTTRSISNLDAEVDDILEQNIDDDQLARRPPPASRGARARRAPRTAARKRADPATVEDMFTSSVADPYAGAVHTAPAPPSRRRARRDDASRSVVDSSDPMAVFFDAAFPSPSKFDEMMMRAGGLPESKKSGRNTRQPNLVLPSSIGRRH